MRPSYCKVAQLALLLVAKQRAKERQLKGVAFRALQSILSPLVLIMATGGTASQAALGTLGWCWSRTMIPSASSAWTTSSAMPGSSASPASARRIPKCACRTTSARWASSARSTSANRLFSAGGGGERDHQQRAVVHRSHLLSAKQREDTVATLPPVQAMPILFFSFLFC